MGCVQTADAFPLPESGTSMHNRTMNKRTSTAMPPTLPTVIPTMTAVERGPSGTAVKRGMGVVVVGVVGGIIL